jgi:ABC-2 type transport system permease protein
MTRTLTIFGRELRELRLNKTFFQTMALFPILMIGLPVMAILLFSAAVNGAISNESLTDGVVNQSSAISGNSTADILASVVAICFSFFLPVPMVLPMTIASHSVVGEKEKKSLEPLLVTPVKTNELLIGKALSAVVPTVALCWGSFLGLVIVMQIILLPAVVRVINWPVWSVTVFTWTPLLAIMTALVGVVLSSKAKDARAAQQTGSLMVLPLLIIILGLAFGYIQINWGWCLAGIIIGLVLDVLLYRFALRTFERENILTRWK